MQTYPSTNVFDFLRLCGGLLGGILRHPRRFNVKALLLTWMQGLVPRYGSQKGVILNFWIKKILLIFERDLSDHILESAPSQQAYVAGKLKQSSMSFLAPEALTISHDRQWQQLRPYTETVLATHGPHPDQGAFLTEVQAAFSGAVTDLEDIRRRMGTAMLGIVFGPGQGSQQLVEDVRVLSGLVESPLKRMVVGRFQGRRRKRLYGALQQLWENRQGVEMPSLLAMAHTMHPPEVDEAVLLQQIPHWMFTFTGSGSLLLGRSLTLITAQPKVLARVLQELEESSPVGQPQTAEAIARLTYLEACVLETGRLYPPVLFTLHNAPQGDTFQQRQIPAGMDILQVFSLMQRASDRPIQAADFQPERWLMDETAASQCPYSNLFLSGARACPGKDLILFVVKGAIAHVLTHQTLRPAITTFSQAAWPGFFPDQDIQFQSQSLT
jgi:hypothetical protein